MATAQRPDLRCAVLCAGTDSESRRLLTQVLPEHQVVFALNAFEAIRMMHAHPFHGYVLDYWLSDLSGVALCREIRKVDAHVPVVFCSGAAREAERHRALGAGASAYLFKPLDAGEVRARLEALLRASLLESLRAKAVTKRTVANELARQHHHASHGAGASFPLSPATRERLARSRGVEAFVEARGTRAYFESWWPQIFGGARAEFDLARDRYENA